MEKGADTQRPQPTGRPLRPQETWAPRVPGERPPLPGHPIAPSACGPAHKMYNYLETLKPTTYLPGRDPLSCPEISEGCGAGAAPPAPPAAAVPQGPALWASGTSSLRADDPPGAQIGLPGSRRPAGLGRAAAGADEPGPNLPLCAAAAAARPLRPSPRALGLPLGGLCSSLRPAHTAPRPLGVGPDGRPAAPQAQESSPTGGRSLGTTASRDLRTDRKRERSGGTARARTRTQGALHMRRTTPAVRLPKSISGAGPVPGLCFP